MPVYPIPSHPSAIYRVIVAVVVVSEAEFGIVVLAGPQDGLGDTASRRTVGALAWQAIGGVSVVRTDITGRTVHLAYVLRQIPAIGVPCAVLLERQRAGGGILRGVPGDVPQRGVVTAGKVDVGNLQVAAVDVALMQRHTTIERHFLRGSAAHGVVLAMHGGDGIICRYTDEFCGAVFGIVAHSPDTGARLHSCLVTVCIVLRLEVNHTIIHRVAAGEGGDNTCRVLLRKRKAIHHHGLGCDGAGGHRTVLHSFRMFTILRPLGGSQAAFADKNRFRLQRARKLRDELYCTLAFICSLAT